MSVSPGLALPNVPKKNDGHIDIYIYYIIFIFIYSIMHIYNGKVGKHQHMYSVFNRRYSPGCTYKYITNSVYN